MKKKSVFLTIAILMLTIGLVGCSNSNNETKDVFTLKSIGETDFSSVYKICDTDSNIFAFFPVVTNLPITSVEAGGVGASLIADEGIKTEAAPVIKLVKTEQKNLNIEYRGSYISFVKFCVKIENAAELNQYKSFELRDTKIWLYHNEEYQTVDFDDKYMEIKIVDDKSEVESMNWSAKLSQLQSVIEKKLS